VAALRHLCCH